MHKDGLTQCEGCGAPRLQPLQRPSVERVPIDVTHLRSPGYQEREYITGLVSRNEFGLREAVTDVVTQKRVVR